MKAPLSKKTGILLGMIILTGLIMRLAVWIPMLDIQELSVPLQDAEFHDYWAYGLATGDWELTAGYANPRITERAFFRPPLYAWFLAAVYRIFSPAFLSAIFIQILISLFSIYGVYRLTQIYFSDAAALCAAFIMATYWVFITYDLDLLDPSLHIALLLAAFIVLLERPFEETSRIRVFSGGALLGLSALLRPTSLVFPILFAAYWLFLKFKNGISLKHSLAALSLLGLGLILAVAPATMRNWIVAKEFVPISANGGLMLYMGNSPTAGGFTQTAGLNMLHNGKYRSCFDYDLFVERLSQKRNGDLSYSEASAFLAKKALNYIYTHPKKTVKNWIKKTVLYLTPSEISHNRHPKLLHEYISILHWYPWNFGIILGLWITGAGLLFFKRNEVSRNWIWAQGMAWLYLFSHVPFVVSTQYRVAVIPLLLPVCGYTLSLFGSSLFRREWKTAYTIGFIMIATTFALQKLPAPPSDQDAGLLYQKAAVEMTTNASKAIETYRELLKRKPDHAWAHGALGSVLAKEGKLDAAIRHFYEALKIEPDYPIAQINLAYALHLKGRHREALTGLDELLSKDPFNIRALHAKGEILMDLGGDDHLTEAEALLEKASSLSNGNSPAIEQSLKRIRGVNQNQ